MTTVCGRGVGVMTVVAIVCALGAGEAQEDGLRKALTFHAAFDGTTDAAHAAGDSKLYWTPTMKQRQEAKAGLPASGEVRLDASLGRFGGALRFTAKKSPAVFFRAARNMAYARSDWNGTVSFW